MYTARGIRNIFIITVILLSYSMLSAQVKIKERVEIKPQKIISFDMGGGRFEIEFSYSGQLQENTVIWKDIIINSSVESCSSRHYDSSPLITGMYKTRIDWYAKTTGTGTYRYLANGIELLSGEHEIATVPAHTIINKNFYFSETFGFDEDSVAILPGPYDGTSVMISGRGATCQPNVGWSSYYYTTWTIVEGEDWGYFYDWNNTPVGKTYNGQAVNMNGPLGFRFNEGIPDTAYSIVKAVSNGIVKYKKIYQSPKELHHFNITIVPDTVSAVDTVAFTEGASLIIQAKDINDRNTCIDTNTKLKFSVLSNEEYGTFINVNGDTLKTTPVQLMDIYYGDASTGRIKFAAVKKNPISLVPCRIRVEKQDDLTKYGERDAIVVEQTLKIVMDAPYEVLPTKLSGRSNQQITEENRKSFSVQFTRNRVMTANYPFVLTTNYVDRSGGHDHINPRRPYDTQDRRRDNYGFFIRVRDSRVCDRPFNGQTQIDGRENFEYVASIFGDSMRIIVESANPVKRPFFKDSVTIAEKVPNLVMLDAGADYELVGGTCEHHGPGGTGECAAPNNNHWVTADVRTNIQRIASAYHRQFPNEVLRINDMSLPFGGKFDINGRWEGSHSEHRTGRNVDIQSRYMPGDRYYDARPQNDEYNPAEGDYLLLDNNGNGQYDGETIEIFRRITLREHAVRAYLENPYNYNGYPEHWHISF